MNFGSVGTGEKSSTQYFILFDPRDGSIRHVHAVMTLPGARSRSLEEHEAQAKKIAASQIRDLGKLQLLRWKGEEAPTPRHRVDLKTMRLIKA
jgi:hypothetical protein